MVEDGILNAYVVNENVLATVYLCLEKINSSDL